MKKCRFTGMDNCSHDGCDAKCLSFPLWLSEKAAELAIEWVLKNKKGDKKNVQSED
jgi:hypothetical protein